MRPKKDPSARRTQTVHFRVTPLELERLEEVAQSCGMSVTDFVRAAVFGTSPRVAMTDEERQLLTDVRRIRYDLDHVTSFWKVQGWADVHKELRAIVEKLKPIVRL